MRADPGDGQLLVAQLKESLGLNYTEGTVADDLHTQFIKEKKGLGVIGQIMAMVAAVAISIVTAGAGASLMSVAVAQFTAMQAAMVAMVAGTLSSMVGQLITTGSLNIGTALKSGAISGLTAGLTQGAIGALELGNVGISSIGNNIAQGNWTQALGQLGSYAQASVVRSAISAGISTVAYGGSFGQAFAGGLVRDAAALAANAVGVEIPGIGSVDATRETIFANAMAHALIGCAAQGLTGGDCAGGDCAGGAIGGAVSAIAAPLIRDQVYADSAVERYSDDSVRQALTVGLATLVGGLTGAALGADVTSATLAAQNESLNNATSGVKKPVIPDDVRKMMEAERRAFGQTGTVPNSGRSDGPAMVGPSPLVLGGAKGGTPNFIVSPGGTAYPVPNGATGPTPVINSSGNQTGVAFTGGQGGVNGQVSTMRIMDPTQPKGSSPGYPDGYIKYENSSQPKPQGVDPYSGKTLPNSQSHFPITK